MKHCLPCAVSAVFFLLGACATSSMPRTLPPINGMIYDYDNVPVASASITVNGVKTTTSDVNGRFALSDYLPGKYTIRVKLDGHETTESIIEYSNPTQILYIKMYSAEQLLALAEKSFERRNWQETESYLDRAEAIRPESVSLRYMKAALHFRRGNMEVAQKILSQLLSDEMNDPYIHLFLADLCQYSLNDREGALRHLDAFLTLRYDPEIDKRREDLKALLRH